MQPPKAERSLPATGGQRSSLRLGLAVAEDRVAIGGKVSVWFTLTNGGDRPVIVPILPKDPRPAETASPAHRTLLKLIMEVLLDERNGGAAVGSPTILFGDPSTPGETRSLLPGESLVVASNLRVESAPTSAPLRPGHHGRSAQAQLEAVTTTAAGTELTVGPPIVVDSPALDIEIVAPSSRAATP